MEYVGRLYRPPSEARSLIVQASFGCPYNTCTFCSMYKGEKFEIFPYEYIKNQLEDAAKQYTWIQKVFLADGDCLYMDNDTLLKIIDDCYRLFPNLRQVNTYGTTKSILKKTEDELRELKEHGLGIIYLGIESGSDKVLKNIKKGVTQEETIEAGKKVVDSGIKLSVTFIAGLGSDTLSHEHAVESAKVVNEMQPDYFSVLTLLLEDTAPLYKDMIEGKFKYLEPDEVLREVRTMIENIDVDRGMFSMAHASNYININGTFPQDKERLLKQIDYALKNISNAEHHMKWRGL